MLIDEASQNGARLGKACDILDISIRTYERWKKPIGCRDRRAGPITAPANKLMPEERVNVLTLANSAPYCDLPPCQIVPKLADKGFYVASESTFRRILLEAGLTKHRSTSRPRTHTKPKELIATGPNQIWSWDISYLPCTLKGQFYYLYFIMDIYSRKIVGGQVFEAESSEYAAALMTHACTQEKISSESGLYLHSDNGSPMKGATLLTTLQNLGVIPSFSRPSVSNDNPYSESLFKTTKYCPQYPSQPFESLEAACIWVDSFIHWYNHEHLHSGIKFVTPAVRHQHLDKSILLKRKQVYEAAKALFPNRWSRNTRNWEHIGTVALSPSKSSLQAKDVVPSGKRA